MQSQIKINYNKKRVTNGYSFNIFKGANNYSPIAAESAADIFL